MVTVYFDGKCGLCAKEIRYYQKIAPAGIFSWCDIAHDPSLLAPLGISQADALRWLHTRDGAGNQRFAAYRFARLDHCQIAAGRS
ncbi:MAG: DUF393 domain-containing protein [Proteobacteria bacterium]|nr:DUF393 domain-containing protein [Pseudomonadota bacterium]